MDMPTSGNLSISVVVPPRPQNKSAQRKSEPSPTLPPRPSRSAQNIAADFHEAPREMKEKMLQKIWTRADKDGNGLLDSDEVLDVLLQMGYNREQINVEETMTEIDEDGNGEVDIDEFRKWFFVQDTSAQEHLTVVYYQSGPGERAETTLFALPGLLATGVITEATVVWVEGMEGWSTLADAKVGDTGDIADKLKGAMVEALSKASPDVKKKLLLQVWEAVDTNGDGHLDKSELRQLLEQMGMETVDELDLAIVIADLTDGGADDNSADVDDDDVEITFAQFERWFLRQTLDQGAATQLYQFSYKDCAGVETELTVGQLPQLVRDGKVDGETQIKFAGQDQWQPLAESPLARAVAGS